VGTYYFFALNKGAWLESLRRSTFARHVSTLVRLELDPSKRKMVATMNDQDDGVLASIIVLVEWGGRKPSSTVYNRLHSYGLYSREPESVQRLTFGGIPVARNVYMETGDLIADTDDGHRIIVERKTPDDFLNTLGSKEPNHQLFIQLARMVQPRYDQHARGGPLTYWPYLVITEPFRMTEKRKIITARGETGWDWRDVNGAILKIQEMGVFVAFADGDADYENCILRIGKRERTPVMTMLPAREANVLGSKATFIQSLARGIGMETTVKILDYYEDNISRALLSIVDMSTESPVNKKTRQTIREMFGLADGEILQVKGEIAHA